MLKGLDSGIIGSLRVSWRRPPALSGTPAWGGAKTPLPPPSGAWIG